MASCSTCPNSYLSVLLFWLLCMILICIASANDNPSTFLYCPADSNFTLNSTYQSNLYQVLAALPVSGAPTGFGIATYGVAPDRVFGRGLCDGDLSSSKCQTCLDSAAQRIQSMCPVGKRAIIFYDKCFLRYSDSNFTTNEEKLWSSIWYNTGTVSDTQSFDNLYNDLMGSLAAKAANSSTKFATGQANFTSDITMYGLVECMRDLSSEECHTCLNQSMGYFQNCCSKNQGGVVLRYQCYIRMEIYQYFESTSVEEPPPPPLSTILSPPPQSVPYSGTDPSSKESTGSNDKRKILPLVIVPTFCGFVILVVAIFIILRRWSTRQAIGTQKEDKDTSIPHLFKLQTLRIATNYFSPLNKLGEGGFGSVYKGCLPNGDEIAVKRLSLGSGQGLPELKNEILTLASVQHKNLVKLMGICLDENEKLLIYEFLPNNSLDTFFSDLQKKEQLDWHKRYQIIEGISRGLLYLHEESRLRIIHRDLKTSNILLDENMLPKISDFGLAKIFSMDKSRTISSRIVGTNGYIAPECFLSRSVSTKSDIFSYGVIILEILTGRRVGDFNGSGSAPNLISFVWKKWSNGRPLHAIDRSLRNMYPVNEVLRCIHIALLCVQNDASKRPDMASVYLMLSSYSMNLPVPSNPAFLVDGSNTTTTHSGATTDTTADALKNKQHKKDKMQCKETSINYVTVTEMDPR